MENILATGYLGLKNITASVVKSSPETTEYCLKLQMAIGMISFHYHNHAAY